jgi:hypothetical protein
MPMMQIPVETRPQLEYLQTHGGTIIWDGGGKWIVEIEGEKYGQASFRLADGSLYNPYRALSDVLDEAERIRR